MSLKLAINNLLLIESLNRGITDNSEIYRIEIPNPKQLLKTKTLGQLIGLFEQLSPPNADNVIKLLNTYNSNRNDLVHKIFLKYDNEKDVYKHASKIIRDGERILAELSKLEKQFNEIWKEKNSRRNVKQMVLVFFASTLFRSFFLNLIILSPSYYQKDAEI